MPSAILQTRLRDNIRAAIAEAQAAANIEHLGNRGTFREIALRKLLNPLLRPDLAISTGMAIDSEGSQSPQLDVIVHSARVLPPLMSDDGLSCVPIEACLHIVEVKSRLTRAELTKAVRSAMRVSKLVTCLPGPANAWETFKQPDPIQIPTLFSIFAFGTDLVQNGVSELVRLRDVLQTEVSEEDRSRVFLHDLCVVGRGYWKKPVAEWMCVPAGPDYPEVVEFLTMAADSWPVWMGTRGMMRLRPYLY